MADADFWQDLSNKFSAIPSWGGPEVEWLTVTGLIVWTVVSDSPAARIKFESLAKRGGRALQPTCSDPVSVWLSAVYAEVPKNPAGRFGRAEVTSARYCDVLENKALDVVTPVPDLGTLKVLLEIISENDILTQESASEVTQAQWKTFLGFAERVRHQIPNLELNAAYDPNLTNARMVIRGVRSQIVGAIEKLAHGSALELQPAAQLTIGEQIDRLREDCEAMSIEELAEKMEIHPTNVSRHIRDESKPSRKNLYRYETLFSKLLNRKVVITKTQPKRS